MFYINKLYFHDVIIKIKNIFFLVKITFEIKKQKKYKLKENIEVKAPFVCWKIVSFWKVNSRKVNYFPIFGSVMKKKLDNTFQCLVML
jgi:hypothetical protein